MGGRGRWSGETTRGPTYAALDLGTNNCRLLVARPASGGFRVVDAFSRIVRLGEGLTVSGQLSDQAIGRAVDALRVCARKMERRAVIRSRNVATEACRRAENCADFLSRVRDETGIELEIISAVEEAKLALAGCQPLLDGDEPHGIVFDIGGGSTEVIWIQLARRSEINRIVGTLSLPIGVVGLSERYGGDRISLGTYRRMVEDIEHLLQDFEQAHSIRASVEAGRVQMLGTSGTVTTLASISQGLVRYDRGLVDGAYLDRQDVIRISRDLARMDYGARAELGCVGRERADLVVGGAAILEAIWRTWPVERLRVADRGLREGILLNLMSNGRVRQSGVAH